MLPGHHSYSHSHSYSYSLKKLAETAASRSDLSESVVNQTKGMQAKGTGSSLEWSRFCFKFGVNHIIVTRFCPAG